MLQVSNLSRRYGAFLAVDDISFTIGKGEIVGLLGHNGAGKTTIMKMLSGYLEPNQGRIVINQTDLASNPKQVQQDLGYLPENLPVYPEMSVADYLDYAADLKGIKQNKQAEIKRAIEATEIKDKLLSPIATLSRGYKQRVGVAQAILGRPKLLILDEPTNGLDPTQTEHMRQLIREIAQNATVILSTHIMQEVDALCDRVLILRNGKLAVDAQLSELRSSNHLHLKCSLVSSTALPLFNTITGGGSVEILTPESDNSYHYRLQVADAATLNQVAAELAKAVVIANGDLFQLNREQRDLETLFREVSETPTKEDLNHAA